ncbi:MAG: GNAT family N-acetyltransferase [Candidatus Aenigmatarchaeota archaeon]
MTIRRAELPDASSMASIANAVSVDRNSRAESGLVEYRLSQEEYERRIDGNTLAFVAAAPVAGFCISYRWDFLQKLRETDARARSDELMAHVSSYNEPFVYLDHLCVLPKFQKRGVASALHDYSLEQIRQNGIPVLYCAISHAPWRNADSLRFSQDSGYELITEITTHTGLTFGIYTKEL